MLEESGLVAAYQVGGLDDDTFFTGASRALGGWTPLDVERVHDAWLRGEYPGAGALLGPLEARGVETGILSNTNAAHWRRMIGGDGGYPALRRVRRPQASHLLRAAKPTREAFARFERAVGRDGADVVFFEDSPVNAAAARCARLARARRRPRRRPARRDRAVLRAEGIL